MTTRRLRILGSRGIPNRHGGFESCAEQLAPWLVERGWDVTVYCQEPAGSPRHTSTWRGVTLEHVPTPWDGARGSVWFDAWTTRHAARHDALVLTLGFNTAVFFPWHNLRGRRHVVNMDGVEWRRGKWPRPVRGWFYANSWVAGLAADHLIADQDRESALLPCHIGKHQLQLRSDIALRPAVTELGGRAAEGHRAIGLAETVHESVHAGILATVGDQGIAGGVHDMD